MGLPNSKNSETNKPQPGGGSGQQRQPSNSEKLRDATEKRVVDTLDKRK
jgi:hypothetical protein